MIKEFFENIFANAKARADDPFIGPFVVSWVLWNWNHFVLIFFGEDKVSIRVGNLYDYFSNAKFWQLNAFFWLPLISTVIYIFIIPWVKFYLNKISIFANKMLHSQAVNAELEKIWEQKKLNEAILLSDPSKRFLEKVVETKLDIEAENARALELMNKQRLIDLEYSKSMADKIRAEASSAEAQKKIEELSLITTQALANESVLKEKTAEVENKSAENKARTSGLKYELEAAKLRSQIKANTFPSLYVFVDELSNSFAKKNIFPNISFLSNIVALVFGYSDVEKLLKDEDFTNETFEGVEYVFLDEKVLSRSIETFILFNPGVKVNVDSITVLNCIKDSFERLPYKFVNLEDLKDLAFEYAEGNRLELFHSGELTSVLSSNNSDFKDIIVDDINEYDFSEGFSSDFRMLVEVAMIGDDSDYERSIPVKVEVRSEVVLGKYALGEFEFTEVVDLD